VEESKSEESESESEGAQGLLMSMVYNILLVLIETCCGVSSIVSTSWGFLEMEKEQLEVKWEGAKNEQELMLHMQNVASSQHYVA